MSTLGRKSRDKHESGGSDSSENDPKLSKENIDQILPVLKEVIKAVYPAASMSIEAAYFLYQNADDLIKIYQYIQHGDTNGAIKTAIKIMGKEIGEQALGYICTYYTEDSVEAISSSATASISNVENRETAKKITQGTINGVIEAMNEKIIDKSAERLENNEKE